MVVERERKHDTPIKLVPSTPDPNHRVASFRAVLEPKNVVEGDFHILVHRPSSADRLVVPVSVRFDEGKRDEN